MNWKMPIKAKGFVLCLALMVALWAGTAAAITGTPSAPAEAGSATKEPGTAESVVAAEAPAVTEEPITVETPAPAEEHDTPEPAETEKHAPTEKHIPTEKPAATEAPAPEPPAAVEGSSAVLGGFSPSLNAGASDGGSVAELVPPDTEKPGDAKAGVATAAPYTVSVLCKAVSGGAIQIGEKVLLIAFLSESIPGAQFHWQYAVAVPGEGDGGEDDTPENDVPGRWMDRPDAESGSYLYTLTEENAGWYWRVVMTVPQAADAIYASAVRVLNAQPAQPTGAPEAQKPASARRLPIVASIRYISGRADGSVWVGDTVTLAADIADGTDGLHFQWQYAPSIDEAGDEGAWTSVPGATDTTYRLTITRDNYRWAWRLHFWLDDAQGLAERE